MSAVELDDGNLNQNYTLTVMGNSDRQEQIFTTMELYYLYRPRDGAPPCEVYNFSVTSTYIGATYTGAGCSVPSQMLSRMLPSLPDVSSIESSLDYVLERNQLWYLH